MKCKIREFRKEAGISQKQLAEVVGVSMRTVGSWERGESFPDAEQLWEVCAALNAAPNDILGWWDDHPRESPPDLTRDERELVGCYRDATEGRKSAMMMAARDYAAMSKDAPGAGRQAAVSEVV